jgi:hypothetical protein
MLLFLNLTADEVNEEKNPEGFFDFLNLSMAEQSLYFLSNHHTGIFPSR